MQLNSYPKLQWRSIPVPPLRLAFCKLKLTISVMILKGCQTKFPSHFSYFTGIFFFFLWFWFKEWWFSYVFSYQILNMRKPSQPLSLQHWTLMWRSAQKTWFSAQAVCIVTCSTSYSFYSAVYSGWQLLPCCRGKQPSKFQAAALSPGFHQSCCSFWSSSQHKITDSPPCAVLQVTPPWRS